MNKREAIRQHEQAQRLQALGFTESEANSLRRISMTLQRWYEHECNGYIQRDEGTNRPHWHNPHTDSKHGPVPDREKGAIKRLDAIVAARNDRENPHYWHDSNPWKDSTVYVPLAALAECLAGGTCALPGGEIVERTPQFILEGWQQVGARLDSYILPQPSGWHCAGVRYGAKGHEYLSPHAHDRSKLEALLKQYQGQSHVLSYYLQADPRGAALYIIRPGDVPAGEDVSAYYTRGICIY